MDPISGTVAAPKEHTGATQNNTETAPMYPEASAGDMEPVSNNTEAGLINTGGVTTHTGTDSIDATNSETAKTTNATTPDEVEFAPRIPPIPQGIEEVASDQRWEDMIAQRKQLLTSGVWGDIILNCGPHQWKLHRQILKDSSGRFLEACEGSENIVEFNEEKPSVIARALWFIYTRSYPERFSSMTFSELGQFHGLKYDDLHIECCAELQLLHASSYVIALIFDIPTMHPYARKEFYKAMCHEECFCTQEIQGMPEDFIEDFAWVVEEIYEMSDDLEDDPVPRNYDFTPLKDVLAAVAREYMDDRNAMTNGRFCKLLDRLPAFHHDISSSDSYRVSSRICDLFCALCFYRQCDVHKTRHCRQCVDPDYLIIRKDCGCEDWMECMEVECRKRCCKCLLCYREWTVRDKYEPLTR